MLPDLSQAENPGDGIVNATCAYLKYVVKTKCYAWPWFVEINVILNDRDHYCHRILDIVTVIFQNAIPFIQIRRFPDMKVTRRQFIKGVASAGGSVSSGGSGSCFITAADS